MFIIPALIGFLVSATLAIWLGWNVYRALATGTANAAGTLHRRNANPFMYWLTVLVQVAFTLVFIMLQSGIIYRLTQ